MPALAAEFYVGMQAVDEPAASEPRHYLVAIASRGHQHWLTCVQPESGLCLGVQLDTAPLGALLERAASVALDQDFLVMAGGYTEAYAASSGVFALDARDLSCLELAPLKQARVAAAIATDGRRLFVLGGVDHRLGGSGAGALDVEEVLDSVEVHEPDADRWSLTTLPRLPKPIHSCAAAVGGASPDGQPLLIVSGGVSDRLEDDIPLADVWHLRLSAPAVSWTALPALRTARQNHVMLAWAGDLLVFGGQHVSAHGDALVACREVEQLRLSERANAWTPLPAPPEEWGQPTSCGALCGDRFYLCMDAPGGESVLRAFHLPSRQWLEAVCEPVGDACHHLALLRMNLHAST